MPARKDDKERLEKEIEDAVCKHARSKGWLAYKFNSEARRSVPDRLMISPGGQVLFIEFKRLGRKPTEQQEREHTTLRANGQRVAVIDTISGGIQLIDSVR